MAGEKRKHPPIPVIVVVLALLIGGGVWWWWSSTHPTTVSAQEQVSGSVEANEYQVAAALSGRITDVKVAEGDKVTKGQELVRLDRSATKLVLDQANQGVTAAKAALTNAKDDDDSTKADIAAAKARLKQAEAAVKLAQVQLGYTIVTAPRDGTVVSLTTNTGPERRPRQDPADDDRPHRPVRPGLRARDRDRQGQERPGRHPGHRLQHNDVRGHGELHRQPGGVHARTTSRPRTSG